MSNSNERNIDTVNKFRAKHPRCRYCVNNPYYKHCAAKNRNFFIGEARRCECYKPKIYEDK